MKRGGQMTLSLSGSMQLVPASCSALAVPAVTGQPDADGPMELAAKRARTEVDAGLQLPAANPATLAAKPEEKKEKKQKPATHVTMVHLNIRILYAGMAIAVDLSLGKVSAAPRAAAWCRRSRCSARCSTLQRGRGVGSGASE